MRRRISLLSVLLTLLLTVLLTACNGQSSPTATPQTTGPVLGWDQSPNTVIVRLDHSIGGEKPFVALNRLPSCTVYGDGHVVWVNPVPPGEEVLEGYIDETKFRSFVEFIIRDQKFYDVPDFASQELPPSEDAPTESITLNLSQDMRTIRSFRSWPNNTYVNILNACRSLVEARAVFIPAGAWVTVYEVERNPSLGELVWSPVAPFKLGETAASGKAVWASGVVLNQVWRYIRENLGSIQWIENSKAYRLAIQVPGVSRDAPPPPPGSETPTPEPSPTGEGS